MSDFIRPDYSTMVYADQIADTQGDSLETELDGLQSQVLIAGQTPPTKHSLETFGQAPVFAGTTGAAIPTGTAGDVNVMLTQENHFEYSPKGTQTLIAPKWAASTALDIAMDNTANDGVEITQGVTSSSRMAMTAGTDRFYVQGKLTITDVSGTDDCAIGWRKAEAYQANVDDYDEAAFVNCISGDVKIETILNNGATATTDTTANVADGEYLIVRVEYDHLVGLSSAITLANAIKSKFNSHIADASEHTTAIDTANIVTSDDATDLASLLTLVNELTIDYDAHEGDSELGAAWLYHGAQEAGNVSLAATTAVTSIPTAIKRLNDMKTKFTAHDADDTAHGTKDEYPVTTASASSTTFKVGINTATVAVPATTAPFTFDDGEVVVPFLFFLHDTDVCQTLYLSHWEVGTL